jgi:hypothetical protein
MLKFETKKDVKSLVSGLRRELKAQNIELGHNKLLDLMAKSLGFKGAEELSATLLESPAPDLALSATAPQSRYPLSNDQGQFDFCKAGSLVSGWDFVPIFARQESILAASAGIGTVVRDADCTLAVEYAGDTDINWDNQKPDVTDKGQHIYIREDEETITGNLVLVIPNLDECLHVHDWTAMKLSTKLKLRMNLIKEYQLWFKDVEPLKASLAEFNRVYDECTWAAKTIGFALTAKEVVRFIELQRNPESANA